MQTVTLNSTSLRSSALGFGCVSLTAHADPAAAVALLERALDLGITHFDVARLYGYGQAESILGTFLQGKRDRVTVATKFGLTPNENLAKHRRLVSIARRTFNAFPALRKLIPRRPGTMVQAGAFDPQQAAASLEKSLGELRTDHVDLFMLHEATLPDAQRGDLLEFLDGQVKRGTVRYRGVASSFEHLPGDLTAFPPEYRVIQTNHTVVRPNLKGLAGVVERGIITFGVLGAVKTLLIAAAENPNRARRFGDRIGVDLSNPKSLHAVVLGHAVASNRAGITLFATTRAAHLAENVAAIERVPPSREQLDALDEYAREATAPAAAFATPLGAER